MTNDSSHLSYETQMTSHLSHLANIKYFGNFCLSFYLILRKVIKYKKKFGLMYVNKKFLVTVKDLHIT